MRLSRMFASGVYGLLVVAVFLSGGALAGGDDFATGVRASLAAADRKLVRRVLDNGMVCLIRQDRSAPVVAVQIWVGVGSIHEGEKLGGGLCHAIEHMIFKGTSKRGPTDITRDINDAGGEINAYTSLDRTVFHVQMPSTKWRTGLEVLADAVMDAQFPEDEWKKEKDVILREIDMGRDDPGRVIDKLLWSTAFTAHPYKHPVIGHKDVFRSLSRADLFDFARKNYVPDNMIVVVVGDADPSEVEQAIKETFAGFKRKARPPVVMPAEPAQVSPRVAREVGAYNVARLELAYHTVPLSHPDAAALDVLAMVAGSGDSSRLVRRLRDEEGLVFEINAYSYTPVHPGLFGVSAVFDPAKEEQVLKEIDAEIGRWLEGKSSRAELEKARRQVLAGELSQLQTMAGQAGNYASGEFYAADPLYSQTYIRQIGEVTPESVRDVARKYLRPWNRTTAVLSPVPGVDDGNGAGQAVAEPAAELETLPGGLRLISRRNSRLPFVYVCVAAGGGVAAEDSSTAGVTKLMSDLLVAGTGRRTRAGIATEVESLGAELAPFSGYDSFGLKAKCFSADAGRIVSIVADCLLSSRFPADELEKQRTIQLAGLDRLREDPLRVAQDSLRQILFPAHPYRWHTLGTIESVQKIDRDAIQAFARRTILASNVVIAVFGDITHAEARRLVAKGFADLPGGTYERAVHAQQVPDGLTRTKRREPREQAVVLVGFPGISIFDTRADAMSLLQTAMSGLSSELGIEVREKRGMAYYVGAYQHMGVDPGAFVLYAGTSASSATEVEQKMFEEVGRVVGSGLSEAEFLRARSQMLGDLDRELQNELDLAQQCALYELYGQGFGHVFGARNRIGALTMESVWKAASGLLATNAAAVSIVLPDKPDEPVATGAGEGKEK